MIWLIAEDEIDILTLTSTMCQVWGHTPLTFANGDKVWNWLDEVEAGHYKGEMPGLALMDMRMPGKYGNVVANRMRTIPVLQKMPIALMTAYALSPDDRANLMKADGIDQIIAKPLPSFEELGKTLSDLIRQKQTSHEQG